MFLLRKSIDRCHRRRGRKWKAASASKSRRSRWRCDASREPGWYLFSRKYTLSATQQTSSIYARAFNYNVAYIVAQSFLLGFGGSGKRAHLLSQLDDEENKTAPLSLILAPNLLCRPNEGCKRLLCASSGVRSSIGAGSRVHISASPKSGKLGSAAAELFAGVGMLAICLFVS